MKWTGAAELAKLCTPIKSLKPDLKNARKHGDRNMAAIKASLQQFGQQKPIVALADGTVIAGNGTLAAAQGMGWDALAVVRFADRKKARAFAIADNRTAELATWDKELLGIALKELSFDASIGLGFSEIDLKGMGIQKLTAPVDEAPAPPKKPTSRKGQVYLLGRHRLMCGDSTRSDDLKKLMGGGVADMVFTDPPYGVAYGEKNEFLNAVGRGNRIQTPIENDGHIEGAADVFQKALVNAFAHTTDKAALYATGPTGDCLPALLAAIDGAGWQFKHLLVWVKNNIVLGRTDYAYKHEGIYYGWKKNGTHAFYGKGETTVWEIDKPHASKLHPTMKPIELVARAITNATKKGEAVLDMFCGSGSTIMACEQTERIGYGMEFSEAYCDVIIKRWEEYTGGKTKLVTGGGK